MDMMINGVDIIRISRVEDAYNKWGEKFLNKIFTDYERQYIFQKGNIFETMAGLYSGKEAVSKALGTGIGKIDFLDIEINHDKKGKPHVNISKNIRKEMKIKDISISISHDGNYAIAFVICRRDLIEE